MNFSVALDYLKLGKSVQRTGWNGKGMWLFLINGNEWDFGKDPEYGELANLPFIAMKTADNKIVPWLASQTDILAEDWRTL